MAAAFAPPPGHPALALLAEQGIAAEDEVVLRRVLGARRPQSGPSSTTSRWGRRCCAGSARCWSRCRASTTRWGWPIPAGHAALLDAFGVAPALRAAVGAALARLARRRRRAGTRRGRPMAAAQRDEDWLRHAVDELATLRPEPGEEERLAAERQALQQGEKRAEAIAAALAELAPRDRRSPGPAAALRAAARALQRLLPADADAGRPGRRGARPRWSGPRRRWPRPKRC